MSRRLLDVTLIGAQAGGVARMRARLHYIAEQLDRFEEDQSLGSPFAGHVPIAAVRCWMRGVPYVG